MGYPVILNGDHAEFEHEHATTPPHERPDWPLPSFDARDWAAAFVKTFPGCGVDEGTMLGWFSCALMRGYDEHAARSASADMALIAAAPDLLEALRGVVAVADRDTVEFARARAAITKAETPVTR